MIDKKGQKQEEDNDKKGTLMSLTAHVLIGILFFLPMGHAVRQTENAQIQVELPQDLLGGGPALGLPNQGSGSNPAPGKPDPNAGNSAAKPTPTPDPLPPVKTETPKPVFSKPTPPTSPPRKVETTEDPNAAVIRRQAEQARQKTEEAKYQAEAAARSKRQQEDAVRAAQAQKQAQAEQAARDAQAAKDKFKGKFGNGSGGGTNGGGGTGTGQGNTGRPGNQGQPDGDPNSKVLDGMGRGAGTVNGFGGRGVRSAPKLQEDSQKQGKVVLKVCVDADGSVTSADFSAVGSNTTDGDLIDAAKRNARQYKFAPGGVDKQCGTITYNFIVK
jgi:outer membrane biosynthesis protein TonB